jgi:hypothetical protein
MPGKAIIRVSWASNVVFALSAIPFAAGADDLEALAIVMALVLFAISLGVWVWAFAVAVARSAGGDNIMVGNLFLLEGRVEKGVRWHLFGSFGVCLLITAFTASANPFGVLVPMLPVGLIGLWGARHQTFGPRPGFEPEVRPLRPERKPTKRGASSRRSER